MQLLCSPHKEGLVFHILNKMGLGSAPDRSSFEDNKSAFLGLK